jgi:hypothetical protein
MKSIVIQFRTDQIALIDAEASRSGQSRSRVVRDAVDRGLLAQFDQALADRYAAAYPEGESGIHAW